MPPFIVTYDLVDEESSVAYQPLINDLKSRNAQRYQASCWLVNLDNTADEVFDHYKAMMDGNDKLMVSELTWNHKQERNFKGTNDWLKNNSPSR